jgi:hypothetical protein
MGGFEAIFWLVYVMLGWICGQGVMKVSCGLPANF